MVVTEIKIAMPITAAILLIAIAMLIAMLIDFYKDENDSAMHEHSSHIFKLLLARLYKKENDCAVHEHSYRILVCDILDMIETKGRLGICKDLKGIKKSLDISVTGSNITTSVNEKIKYYLKVRNAEGSSNTCKSIRTENIFTILNNSMIPGRTVVMNAHTDQSGFVKTPMDKISVKLFNNKMLFKFIIASSISFLIVMLICLVCLMSTTGKLDVISYIIIALSGLHTLGRILFSFMYNNAISLIGYYCKYNSVNWLLYKAGIVREVNRCYPGVIRNPCRAQITLSQNHTSWECIFCLAGQEDDRRKDWCNDERIGPIYTEAASLRDESVSHIEAASAAFSVLFGIYQFSSVIVIVLAAVHLREIDVLKIVITSLAAATAGAIAADATILINIGCAKTKMIRAHSLMATINEDSSKKVVITKPISSGTAECRLLFHLYSHNGYMESITREVCWLQ